MRRFPVRTLLLMTLALLAFVRLYIVTHAPQAVNGAGGAPQGFPPGPVAPRSKDCPGLDKALEGVLRTPTQAPVLAAARRQLEACPAPPPRVCELGPAFEVRFPLAAGNDAPRELLALLCQRCPSGANPCARAVGRALGFLTQGNPTSPPIPLWDLEHAGPATGEACTEVVRALLVPLALDEDAPTAIEGHWIEQLVPVCAREGRVSSPLLRAAVARGGVPVLASLVQTKMPTERPTDGAVLPPDRVVGPGLSPADGARAFDGQASTSVKLTVTPGAPRWRKDGALSAVFEPPLQALTGLRVRARGPGVVRAAVRLQEAMGLEDPDTGTHFVLPQVCHFQGRGEWEPCTPPAALLNVEALSVFPDPGSVTLSDVEIRGAR